MGLTVVFLLVTAHIGVSGNEEAYKMAMKATQSDINLAVKTSKYEIRSIIKDRMKKERMAEEMGDR